jgi:ABC-type transport system substrate-binding protein
MTLDAPAFVESEITPVIKNWKDVLNVTVKFNPLDKDTGLPKLQNHDTSAYYLGWDYSTYDMASIFPLLDKNDPSNFTAYSNPQATSLMDKISTTLNLQQRKTLLQQLGKVVLDDAAYIPVWFEPDLYAVKSGLNFPTAAPATWSGS